jgi:predicted kinase
MARVVLMCGPSGSGKTTYARGLQAAGMVRLSFDAVMWERGITDVPLPPDVRAGIEAELRARLLGLVAEGRDVVLDFSFWSRAMRDDYRRLLAEVGVVPETVHLATDRDTVLARVRARRGGHPDDFVVDEGLAAHYYDHFEAPTEDEGPLTVVRWRPDPGSDVQLDLGGPRARSGTGAGP